MADSRNHFSTQTLASGQRVALRVEYDGSAFNGWQAQMQTSGTVRTVQGEIESALSTICNDPVRVYCAGRTDTGVHALAQWVHFDLEHPRSLKALLVGGNAQLPRSVRIADAITVPSEFHARHTAQARRYDYLICNAATASAVLADAALWVREALDHEVMERSLQTILGERDFSAFRAASCQSTTPMRFLESAAVWRKGSYLQIRVIANAFLHHMVRNLVGSLLEIGAGRQPETWLKWLLDQRDRTLAAATAPPHGLYLTDVRYPGEYKIPETPRAPFFIR